MRYPVIIFSFVCLLLSSALGFAGEDDTQRDLALQSARNGDKDFAYMHYRTILENFPKSRYHEEALFAKGEFHFRLPDFVTTKEILTEYLARYPDTKAKIFALAYLLKIAQEEEKADEVKRLEKEIIDYKQIGLVFKESQDVKYLSGLNQHYRAAFGIDEIKFYIDDKVFAQMSY